MKLKLVFLLLTVQILLGCATWSGSEGETQGVFVDSIPHGAKVFLDNKIVGETPLWVRVPREFRNQLKLEYNGQKKIIPLETYYRWGTAFFSNFILLGAWPVGVTVDLVSGEAWSFRELSPAEFELPPKVKIQKLPNDRTTLLSPVIAAHLLQSEEAEERIKSALYKQGYRFDTSDADRDLLNRYDFNFKTRGSSYDRSQVMSLMKQRNFAAFEVKATKDGAFAEGYIIDKLSAKRRNKKIPIQLSSENTRKKFGDFFGLVPNTFGLEFSNRRATFRPVTSPDLDIVSTAVSNGSLLEEAVRLISAAHIGYSSGPRYSKIWDGEIYFIPSGNVSFDTFEYKDFAPLAGHQYSRAYLSGGYGVHMGVSSRYGELYLNLVPQLAYIDIQWQKDGGSLHFSNWSVEVSTEIGYEYYFDNHWYAKLFSRGSSEPIELWQEIFQKTAGYNEVLDSTLNLYSGLQIGYFTDSLF